MTPENFCYWLQGFMEIQNPKQISKEQAQVIKDHLQLVFKKETPCHNNLPKGLKPVNIDIQFDSKTNRDLIDQVMGQHGKIFTDPIHTHNVSC